MLRGSSQNPTLAAWGRIFSLQGDAREAKPSAQPARGSRGQDSWSRTPEDLGTHLPVAGSEWASAALPCRSRKGHERSWPTEPSAHGPARGIVPSSTERQHSAQAASGVQETQSGRCASPGEEQRAREPQKRRQRPRASAGVGRHNPGLVFGYSAARA